ncbi:MAG: nuclear transport factor 2 family protein [Saprospiraceae bacterium]|nr:nuclear transport factor 2 family protein [Saprospiraceae bacterium]
MMKNLLFTIGLAIYFSAAAMAQQSPSDEPLFQEILTMDSLLFTAFNNQDVAAMGDIFDKDLEFYHDKTGLTGYDRNLELLGGLVNNPNAPTRTLLRESMEVYPVPGYGAIQSASHRFCHLENGAMDCGTFKFVHIWHKKKEGWKLTRIVSFDH